MIEDFEAELTGSLTKIGPSLESTCGSAQSVSQGNGPVTIQVGVRITSKLTNVVLHKSSSFYKCYQKLRRFLKEVNDYIIKTTQTKAGF